MEIDRFQGIVWITQTLAPAGKKTLSFLKPCVLRRAAPRLRFLQRLRQGSRSVLGTLSAALSERFRNAFGSNSERPRQRPRSALSNALGSPSETPLRSALGSGCGAPSAAPSERPLRACPEPAPRPSRSNLGGCLVFWSLQFSRLSFFLSLYVKIKSTAFNLNI